MRKLIINEFGEVIIDSTIVPRKEISSDFLYNLFLDSLKNEIEFEIDNTDPISKLFLKIKEYSDVDSDFYKELNKISNSNKQIDND